MVYFEPIYKANIVCSNGKQNKRTYLCEQADINCKTITIHQEVT